MTSPLVAIVLLNYCGAVHTNECVTSLKQLDYPNAQIIVVDNASPDDSVAQIQAEHPDIHLICAKTNGGFSAGNNIGIRYALEKLDAAYVWILNNDTLIPPDALTALVAQAQAHPNTLIGSLILNTDGSFQTVGHRINRKRWRPRAYKLADVSDGQILETLCGCSILVPRQVFETIGLLDEAYFLYLEDTEFCLRASQAGFPAVLALNSKVFHKGGVSTESKKALVSYYCQRNRLIFTQQFATPNQFKMLYIYHCYYRRIYSKLTTLFSNQSDARLHHKARVRGLQDFMKGVVGKCPHEAELI